MKESTRPDPAAAADPAAAGRLMRIATYAAVAAAVLLIAVKAAAWIATGSLSLLGSLIDSMLDALASLLNLVAVRHALTPADAEHRFGHGKAEALAGLAQAAFVCGSAAFLVFEAVNRLVEPRPLQHGITGIAVMLFAIAVTLGLVLYQAFVIRRTSSIAISADSLHYKGDLLTNLGVIAAIVLATQLGWTWADPLFALLIAGVIAKAAYDIFRRAYDHLMDREMSDELRERIRTIVEAHPESRAMHDLRTRWSGNQAFIQLHLELDPDMPLKEAHRIADEIENEIMRAFPGAEVIIHEDPVGIEEARPRFAGN